MNFLKKLKPLKELKELLSLATKDSRFIFEGTLYKQIDGMAMGSPLGPPLANAFIGLPQEKLA